jgi:sirohydrochlorin ferrochelatase
MKYGVLVVGHGSREEEWVGQVDEAVAGVSLPADVQVEAAFLELVDGRLIQDGIDRLASQGVTDLIVVPLFVSSGSTHVHEIGWALGAWPELKVETDLRPFKVSVRVHYGDPIDDDPDVAEVVYEKIKSLSIRPEKEIVILVGHGSDAPGFYEQWAHSLGRLAARVQERGGFAGSDWAVLLPDQLHSKVEQWRTRKPDWDVIVAPMFVSEGYFTRGFIPSRLDGLECKYNGRPLLPSRYITRWIERQAAKYILY